MRSVNWKGLVPYLILVIMVSLGIYLNTAVSRKFDRKLCLASQQNRDVVRDLVNRTGPTVTIPPTADPVLAKLLEDSRRNADEFRAFANTKLAPIECPK